MNRLDDFFKNQKWNLEVIQKKVQNEHLPEGFKFDYDGQYRPVCKFVHPNLESLKLSTNRTDDDQFNFLVPNINLAIWYASGIISLFSKIKMLNFDTKIDQEKLGALRSTFK